MIYCKLSKLRHRVVKLMIFTLAVLCNFSCSLAGLGIYEPPQQGPISQLQLDVQSLRGVNFAVYPSVFYYDNDKCVNRKFLNYNIDLFYREGNPPQDLSNNIWRDYVGYKMPAEKEVVIAVIASRQHSVYADFTSFIKTQILKVYSCSVTLAFKPEQNEIYRLVYRETEDGCKADIMKVKKLGETPGLSDEVSTRIVIPGCFDHKTEKLETRKYL